MTVAEWLNKNDNYDEATMLDTNGNPCNFWINNDPKYKANVIKVVPRDNKYPWLMAMVYTDYNGKEN